MEFAKNVTNYFNDQNAVELLLSVLTDPIKNRKLSTCPQENEQNVLAPFK